MRPRARRQLRSSGAAVCLFAIVAGSTACASNDYRSMKAAVRDWSAAVETGDSRACRLEHPRLQEDLSRTQDAGTSCRDRVKRELFTPPPPDADFEVLAWDPSGEAVVRATAAPDQTMDFSLILDDDRWLLNGLLE